jgi:hypothetical protein
MTRLRKQLPAQLGEGELRYRGMEVPVDYEIKGEPASLRLGPGRLSGSLSSAPDVAAEVFRAGEAQLALANGEVYRITIVGHSAGSSVAYFEMRI